MFCVFGVGVLLLGHVACLVIVLLSWFVLFVLVLRFGFVVVFCG